jgi:hypothetical protein
VNLRRLPATAREALLLELALYRSLARWIARRPDVVVTPTPVAAQVKRPAPDLHRAERRRRLGGGRGAGGEVGHPCPAIGPLWRAAWEQFTPFLDYTCVSRC